MFADIRLKMEGTMARVFVNGKEIDGVLSADFRYRPDEAPTVMLGLAADNAEIETEEAVVLVVRDGKIQKEKEGKT